ncbi:Acetyl-/propionyl-coenzyme A carboxylase alpha chain [Thalassovita gelatinovora]|uniref:Acetyl-/propionyl-coenzyme A carboxylase alpha chain n=1 Tax=Thalassovita gelatinovora TaxID=53501 RepID=A0A0P1FLL4_THAGE|nr:acetyl-CoA carboxylase biotin carboxylase subunit [Thalassovita gelatinovora]QIZ79094.1 acetyl-CoA carboxylase biotin carboxylase subunit [Thalassovita gelatinovora]CUH68737.1 Acetyl-/propionyl-coenzyme A carboxylase alpha chain [Thalassovita gelatinovora]SEQ57590.1 geranyl-CoA carboxylase alpha subunit [Thalassovita gelatinovora]
MLETPFQKLLIANRGEIALRIMGTAQRMGMATVAVYSDADRDATHVRVADQAAYIGAAAPSQSYLNIDVILKAAHESGAQAVHPGYGFLAENADFAEACTAAGLIFVGPSADTIRRMGDKLAAKAAMIEAGVPCVPGFFGDDQSPSSLQREAEQLGFPVMIKARAGGGGRGMRLVTRYEEFDDALSSAKSEAMTAFGDDRILLERAIETPRHVEVQILADRRGHVIHLGERDCSVQRRHQKLIEESPSPAVNADLRDRMGRASVRAAQAIGYEGAGTFEYLLDGQGKFFFMEMNTRLQVEHPVTEALTGLDLVEWQMRIAMGEDLTLIQDDVPLHGHAIELRLCAEDPGRDFLPQSGRVLNWQPATDLRVDHAMCDGAEVPAQYDSMIAKLIAHGTSREDARRRLVAGLKQTIVTGVRTNQGVLVDCLRHPVFVEGDATTGFIAQHKCDLLPDPPAGETAAVMVLSAILAAGAGTALPHRFAVPIRLGRDDKTFEARVAVKRYGQCEVALGEGFTVLQVTALSGGAVRIRRDGLQEVVHMARDGDRVWLHIEGQSWDFADLSFAPVHTADETGTGKIAASMNGTVSSVGVVTGQQVTKGQVLVVLEAMKMEHDQRSDITGTVAAIHVSPGDQVTAQTVLVEVAPDDLIDN